MRGNEEKGNQKCINIMEIEFCIIPSAYVSACTADCGWEGGLSLLKKYPRIPDLSKASWDGTKV